MATSESQPLIHTVAQYPIQCANEVSVTSLESLFKLGPLDDVVFPFVRIENVFVYRQPVTSLENSLLPINRLRQALSYLLDYYPHLTGRLQFNPETHAPEITRLGTGAVLHEAHCHLRLDDLVPPPRASNRLLVTDLPNGGTALITPFDSSIEGVCRDPLLAIQHTRFACGGVVLGIRVHHILCDAGGYFQLVRDIAEIYRGLSSSDQPTLNRVPQIRPYLQDINVLSPQDQKKALEYKPPAYYVEPFTEKATSTEPEPVSQSIEEPTKPPITGRVLRFSGAQLHELKQLAIDPSGKDWVSTFEALCAYLYQIVYRARAQLLQTQGVSVSEVVERLCRGFWASINMRDSSRLDLGANYFPNAIQPVYGTFAHELLADGNLWMVAKALHDLVRSVDVQQMEQTTRWIAVQPDKSRIRVGFTFADGNFTVSQWSRLQMYKGVDFDVDKEGTPVHPVLVSPPLTEISCVDALAMILSTEEDVNQVTKQGTTAIDVNLTLTEPLWSILNSDAQFRKYYHGS